MFQLLTFPARPQIRPAQPTGISPLLHFTLLLLGQGFGRRGGGIRSPWSATRGQLSFYPVPRGGSLSQEYPFTDANIILNVMWSSSVSQHCHTPTITPPPPPPPPALTHILNSKAEAITPIFTISSSLQNRPDKRDQKHGHAAKTHPQTSLWPDPQRKSKCKSHHPAPFFCPSVTQSTKPLIIQPLLPPPAHDPFPIVAPPFSTKLMVALVTPLPTRIRPNYHTSQKH